MQEKPTTIQVKDYKVPLWCDLFVLNEIQDRYGTINAFEKKLLGISEKMVAGEIQRYKVEPSTEAVLFVLPLMIKEGYKKAEQLGEKIQKVDAEQTILDMDISYEVLAQLLHQEFKRCFATKK